MLERNSKVVLDVAQALQAAALEKKGKGSSGGSNGEKCVEVAVLYGGLHLKVGMGSCCVGVEEGITRTFSLLCVIVHSFIQPPSTHKRTQTKQDMEEKLVRHLNFTRDPSISSPSPAAGDNNDEGDAALDWTTAWTMPAYTSTRPALVAALCVTLPLVYLGVGAADWSATFGDIARDIALGGEPQRGWRRRRTRRCVKRCCTCSGTWPCTTASAAGSWSGSGSCLSSSKIRVVDRVGRVVVGCVP